MSIYPAPTNQQGSIFNPSLWIVSNDNGVTTAYLDANYLRFPVAQGNINLSGMTNIGTTTLDDILDANANININGVSGVNYLQFPDGSQQFSAGGGGGGDVLTTANNTFLSPATTQTFNAQNVVISNGLLSLTNGTTIPISGNGGNTNLYFPTSFPSGSQGSNAGLGFYWNNFGGGGTGETDLICYGQAGVGGLSIYAINGGYTGPASLISSFFTSGISFNQDITSGNTYSGNNLYSGNNTYSAMNTFTQGYINIANLTTAPTPPPGYSQYISLGGLPYFSPNGGGANQLVLQNSLANYALLASPAFSGTPTSTTASLGDNSGRIATTAFVATSFAPLVSPALTGTPTSTTPTSGDSSTNIATTAFVATSFAPLASPTFTGIPTAPTALSTDNSTQLATTAFVQSVISGGSNNITFQWTASLSGGNTQWGGYIPYSVNATIVSFQFFSNTPPNNINIGAGETVVPSNTQLSGFGIGYKQPYYAGGGTYSYGYVFSILSYNGLSISSPNLLLKSVAIFPQTNYPCYGYLTGANDGGYIYTTANNGLTIIITQDN